jgi:Zn-dependent protease
VERPQTAATDVAKCAACATEIAPDALACPACHTLVYAGVLKDLAATAERQSAANDLTAARDTWTRALDLLPADSDQHRAIRTHITALNASIAQRATPAPKKVPSSAPAWKRGLAAVTTAVILLIGKLKFLILGLTKASTFLSMFAFFGVYWSAFGWPLALGLVVSIYIHEMGHVAELRRLGIAAGAPLFIPGLGALVRLRQHIDDPVTDARIGLAGPIWGLGAGVAAWIVGSITHSHTWFAIAQLTGYINLFNLIPVWQLDGSRGFHALNRTSRWLVVAATGAAFFVTSQRLLILVGLVGGYRATQPSTVRSDRRTLLTFVGLIVLLALLARTPVATGGPVVIAK